MNQTNTIPLFPLNTVLFPGGKLALRVFEARYLDMIAACLRGETGFGVCLIRNGSEVGPAADFFRIGTYARIIQWKQHRDGILGINIQGGERFIVSNYEVNKNQLIEAEVNRWMIEDSPGVPPENTSLKELFLKLSAQLNLHQHPDQFRLDDAAWLGYRLAELYPLTPKIKQDLLEMEDSSERLNHIQMLVGASRA